MSNLPASWLQVGFDDAVDLISDRGFRIQQKAYLPVGGLPVVDQGEGLIGGYTNDLNAKVDSSAPVIVFGDHTRRFKFVKFPFAVGADGVKLFSPNGLWDPAFLFLQLGTIDLENRGYGRHYQHLRKELLALPPAAEQTRIVAKLEELLSGLDAGVAELKAAQKKLAQYRQSLLKAAVEGALTAEWRAQQKTVRPELVEGHSSVHGSTGSPRTDGNETGAQLLERILIERRTRWEAKQLAKFKEQGKPPPKDWQKKYPEPMQPDTAALPELPEGWVWATLSQAGWLDRGKSKHRPRNAPHLYGGPYPFVQTGDIRHSDTFIESVEATYSEAGLAQSRLWPVGTMCITIAANIGKTAILSIKACFPDSVVGFLAGADDVSIRYVEYFMRSIQQKLEDEAPATAQKNINLEILEKVAIPIPPIDEQLQMVERLDETLVAASDQNRAITLSLKQSAAQRQNILRAAFAGQLVPQDPNDEPASVLLERIRAERVAQSAATKPQRKISKR